VLALDLPYRLGLLLAMVLGMAAAMLADKLLPGSGSDGDAEATA